MSLSSSFTSSGAPSRDVICASSVSVRFFRKMQYSSGWPPTNSILGISICCGSVIHRQGSPVAQNRVRVRIKLLSVPSSFLLHLPQQLHDPLPVLCGFHKGGEMVGLGHFRSSRRLFPQSGAEIADQIGKMFSVECPYRFSLK